MKTLVQRSSKTYSEQELEKLIEAVNTHNQQKDWTFGYYIIDTTGQYQVYFTLYKYNKRIAGYGNPYKYIKNVSIDLLQTIDTIKRLPLPVLVNYCDNHNPLLDDFRKRTKEGIPVIPIGKYKGCTIADVWEQDRNWVMWFNANYKTQPYTDFRGNERMPKLTEEDELLKEQCKELIDIFWEDMTEKNRAECTSEYIGTIGQRITIEGKVLSVRNNIVNFITPEGNLFYIYDKEFGLERDMVVMVKGTITKHFEKVGKKTTYFNRVAVDKK